MRTNSNTTGYGHSFALASLARRYRDRWMQEGKKVTKFIVESTQSITFPSVEIDYLAQGLENDEYCCIDDNILIVKLIQS